jgi:thioredoxin reductase/Pyruvate/2-oxoacid:ferredoxin oxidoreductase delta subunit
MIDLIIYISVIFLAVMVPALYFVRYRRHQARTRLQQETSVRTGMTEPVSLHPKIDPNKCICSGGCTAACPEGGIIGILGGRAQLVSPTKCIGHGACMDACPVEAITLVFGTETRGVDIPYVKKNFETNVPGIYIAGELGGMGLIRNAVTQGKETVQYIAQSLNSRSSDGFDLVIVGAGPAGLAAALQAKTERLNTLLLEQGDGVGGTILSYPRQKLVMTQPMEIPLHGKFHKKEVAKEELAKLWEMIARKSDLRVQGGEQVVAVTPRNGHYLVQSNRGQYPARRVLLAIGRRGTPRRLGVPGEASSKVAYKLMEPEQYRGKNLLVVGGGDSAVEAAVALAEQEGTRVSLSYRQDVFSRLKEKNRQALGRAVESGRVTTYLGSSVESIEPLAVNLRQGGSVSTLENDYVFVFIGGELPTAFLQSIGISMERKFGQE